MFTANQTNNYAYAIGIRFKALFNILQWKVYFDVDNTIIFFIPADYKFDYSECSFAEFINDKLNDFKVEPKETYINYLVFQKLKCICNVKMLPGRK